MMRWAIAACLAARFALAGMPAAAQESRIAAEFRREAEHFREDCASVRTLMSCAALVATGRPLHLAMGSLAPENGFALGAAFGTNYAPSETWRLSWSADAVRSFRGAWRAAAFMTLVYTPEDVITVVTNPADAPVPGALAVRPSAVIRLHGQTTTLNHVGFYGLGPDSSVEDHTEFGMRHSVLGANLVMPVAGFGLARALNLSLLGEVNGRFVSIREGASEDVPFVGDLFGEDGAPGIGDNPNVLQLGEGVRLRPRAFGDRLRFDYSVRFRQYLASSESRLSFRRWQVDLDHEIPLYGRSGGPETRDANDPNSCAVTPGGDCPAISRDRRGTVGIRTVYITSSTSDGNVVPFYFQPTLGGSDINGHSALPSFDDYRFRGPHVLLFQQSFEHSVWGPIGAWLRLDQGMVALDRGGLGIGDLKHSVAVGFTVRAGGLPMVVVSYARGGDEGSHLSTTINTSLLGGSARPTLD
jgi:hypothetical protein